jgi:hypothetical protein
MADDDHSTSHEIMLAFWGVLMVILAVIFIGVMYIHHKNNRLLQKKLYNFKKAPKTYVDDDSFINTFS